ncbi:HAD family hydrolase [Williamsia sterculiae]|uniref:Haloacid dehalogenase superfamily, subfamily IA, variant 3 with third motif having DD or ED n=1 Tax=Williamsia sterculiae TaxID=1344003 RepID=A0A1N7H5V8_9NOCA|nr:HAD-IA family hydrolase [Williamsia sterculiae]SIS20048.1 haloacid dehalogenase superfamily, subfamily IA, variant 3 with third motif having DD or ED [Williamsia sterculiae]
MSAILFGSISTLADTSELQRQAFNDAFSAHELGWNWSRDDYVAMLGSNGGAKRIAEFAASTGDDVDADAVHATKSEIFQRLLASSGVSPRPGVVPTIEAAKAAGVRVGFVTTTSRDNINALLTALAPEIDTDTFDIVVDSGSVDHPKPEADAYTFALSELSTTSDEIVAIEDNVGGVAAADAAGIRTIAFPNDNTSGGDFSAAAVTVASLDPQHVLDLVRDHA